MSIFGKIMLVSYYFFRQNAIGFRHFISNHRYFFMEDSDFFVKLSSFSEHISNFLYKFFQIGFVKIHSFQKSNFAACQLACHSHWERSKLESALGNSTKRRDRHAAAGQHPAHLMVLSLAHGHKAAAGAERAEISRAADRSVAQREPGGELPHQQLSPRRRQS